MESTSSSLFIGALLALIAGGLIPYASVGAALSLHLVRLPDCPPAYVEYFAKRNDPDHPTDLLARLLSRRRDFEKTHSIHVEAGLENVILIILCNFLPIVANIAQDPYYTAGPLLRLFTAAFFVCEGLWFWWFLRFVSRNRP